MYNALPHYYDAIHQHIVDDITLLVSYAKQQNGPVLELGCGTGRLLAPLAQTNLAITGLDNADAMLAVAKTRLTDVENVSLVSADMTQFSLNQQFALVIISYNTLTHLTTSQLAATLKCIRPHLAVDGILLIDTLNPFLLAAVDDQDTFEPEAQFIDPRSGTEIQQLARYHADHINQVIRIEWLYESANGGESVSAETTHHYHYPHVLQMVLNEQDYSITDIFGDYEKTPFDESSERLIITATVA